MKYIGIPFVKQGRSREGLDCLGLIIVWYRENFGIRIPDVVEIASPEEGKDHLQRDHWVEVEDPRYGDLIFMKPAHLGVCLGDNKILHTTRKTNSVVERYDRSPVRERILGFYRRNIN